MKKVVPLVLLTCVVLAHCVNLVIPSLPLSVISKVTILILSSFVFSSVALLVILAWLDTWPTTKKPDGLNRLSHLKMKEMEIAAGNQKKTVRTSDIADYKDFLNERDSKSIQLTNGTDTLFPLINPLKENHNV